MYFQSSGVVVVPKGSAAVSYLSNACPCNGNWATNVGREIVTCSSASCSDTTWLNGSPKNASIPTIKSLLIGQPFYGQLIASPVWGTPGPFQMSLWDATPIVGWSNPVGITANGTACISPQSVVSMCGSWQEYCSPAEPFNDFASVTSSFSYTGPIPGNGSIFNGDSGVFAMNETLYLDTSCKLPYITIQYTGTMAYAAVSTVPVRC